MQFWKFYEYELDIGDGNSFYNFAELKITGDHLCGGEIFQNIFSQIAPPQIWSPVILSSNFDFYNNIV